MRNAFVGLLLLASLHAQDKSPFDRETAREKAGDCRGVEQTYELNMCLSKEITTSEANYQAYVETLRATLAERGSVPLPEGGPTGRPLTGPELLKNFDQTETAWGKYRDALCSSAWGVWKGGTIVNAMAGECHLMVLRSHMRELDRVYNPRP